MNLVVRVPHRLRSKPIQELVTHYQKCSSRFQPIDLVVGPLADGRGRASPELRAALARQESYMLSEHGKVVDTPWFVRTLEQAMRSSGLLFVVGDASGFPREVLDQCKGAVSLTPLTMPHELAVAVLVEQLWRAVSIVAGHPYHKS